VELFLFTNIAALQYHFIWYFKGALYQIHWLQGKNCGTWKTN